MNNDDSWKVDSAHNDDNILIGINETICAYRWR